MLKRFRRLRGDSEKVGSPQGSPAKSDRGDTSASGTGGSGHDLREESWDTIGNEGFLCPLCMNKFPSPEELQKHFETAHDDTATTPVEPPKTEDTGFLCPQCKEIFPTAETLQAHFVEKHDDSVDSKTTANRDGDVLALRQEIDDLRTTLKEEKWYSTELRKEMEKLQNSGTPGVPGVFPGVTDEEKMELDLLRQQLRASEESRILLSSEVVHLREQLSEANSVKNSIQEAKASIEQKAAKLSGEIVGAKARVDEIEGQRAGFEDHIRTLTEQLAERERYVRGLESQLAQRPGADDVLVLRQELVHAQTLMDQMTLDQEKEKQKLEEEHCRLQDDYRKSEEKLQDLQQMLHSAPRVEEIETLKASLTASASGSDEMIKKVAEKESVISERNNNIEQLKEALHEQVALLQTKETLLSELQKSLAERNSSLEDTKHHLKSTETELISLKEQVARLEERNKLMNSQTHEKGAMLDKIQSERMKADALNQSLQADKLQLSKDLEAMKLILVQKQAELKEMCNNREQLQQQVEKRDSKIIEKDKDLESLEAKLAELRQSGQGKEYEKEQKITGLKMELEKSEARLNHKETTMGDLQRQLGDLERQHQTDIEHMEEGRVQLREKEATLEEECRKLEVRNTKVSELEEQLGQAKENLGRMETERTDLIAKIEAGEGANTAIYQLKQENIVLQEKLLGAENNREMQAKEHQEKVDLLHKQLQEAKSQLQEVIESKHKVEDSLKVNVDKLEATKVKVTELEGELKAKVELLLVAETAKTTQRADLENHIKTVQNSLDEKLNEVSKMKGQLDQVRQELVEEKARVTALETVIRDQTLQTNSLQQRVISLESDVTERAAALGHAETARAALQEDLEAQIQSTQEKLNGTQASLQRTTERLRASQGDNKRLEDDMKEKADEIKSWLAQHNKLEAEHHKKGEELKKLEQSKRSVETQLKVAQDTISEKTSQLEKTQGTLESEVAKLKDQYTKACGEAKSVQSQLKQQIESLESSRTQILEEKTKIALSLGETESALAICQKDLDETRTSLQNKKAAADQALRENTQKIQHLEGQIVSFKEELTTQQGTSTERSKTITELQGKIADYERTKQILESKIKGMEETVHNNTKELKEKGELLLRAKEEAGKREDSLKGKLENATKREDELKTHVQVSRDEKTQLEKQLTTSKEAISSLEQSHKRVTAEFQTQIQALRDEQEITSRTLEEVREAKKNMENRLTDGEAKLNEIIAQRDELKQNKATLENTLIDQQKLYKDIMEVKSSLEKELEATKATTEKERKENQREILACKEDRDMLIDKQLEMKTQVTAVGNSMAALRIQYDEKCEEAESEQGRLQEEQAALQAKLTDAHEKQKQLEREKEEKDAHYEMKLTALNDNLSTIRQDMATTQTRLSDMEKVNNDLLGEKLELEAKLEVNNDQRRALRERCLVSESEVEKLQEKVTEVRRKLDDMQAALHELARENQSLKMLNEKASNRKWADDSEVNNCMNCNKGFSITMRKHHCRQCGNIFCNECSSKTATVASSKKPVRVCEACYADIVSKS